MSAVRRRAGAVVGLAGLVTGLVVALPQSAGAATPGLTGVDLSQYRLVGRYDLPEPSRTTAPTGSLLAQEASSVTYDWDTDSLFVVGDGGTSIVQVSKTGQLIDSMTLAPGSSPQGTTFYDTEAITYVGNGQFVLGEERDRQVNLLTYAGGGTLTRADVKTVKLATTVGNIGIEGITYDPQTSTAGSPGFVAVKEKTPEGIFATNIDFNAGTATNGSPTTDEPTNLFDPAKVGTSDFSDVFALSNLTNLTGPDANNLLVISQEAGKIVEVDRSGNVQSSLTIADPTGSLSVPDETHEGVTMDRNGYLYTVNEQGGGDAAHPQLWVYAPPSLQPSVPRMTISEVAPWGSGTSGYAADWFEVTNDSGAAVDLTGWKMDDSSNAFATSVPLSGVTTLPAGKSAVFFEAPATATDAAIATTQAAFVQAWFGTATPPAGFLIGHYGGSGVGLSSSGDGVNLFDAAGDRVTGVSFGASSTATPPATFDNREGLSSSGTLTPPAISQLSVSGTNGAFVAADNSGLGSPGGLAGSGTTTPPATGTTTVAVTEVAPWASGSSPYAADWFEVTNTGSTAVDLTGWKMDDSSDLLANAVALNGVSSLPAGKSAVFFEDDATATTAGTNDATIQAAFAQAWFGTSSLPAGFLIGHYGGSGVGLSTGGDAVNLFDASGAQVTGVTFGASPTAAPYATFDNTAGAGATTAPFPVLSTLSVVGTNGAVLASDGAEIGSPGGSAGAGHAPASVVVSEVAPWGSGNSSYAADWFEVTNTGSTAVDLTGWKMDDSSDLAANAVALNGVSSLPAGKSAVFFEDTGGLDDATVEAAFAKAWFGTSSLPAGFLIGHYGGSGVGLSTGGDAVNLFDASGAQVTGVTFGASPSSSPYATFDNTAGAGSATAPLPVLTTLSAVGVNGAYLSADGTAIGSPAGASAPDKTPPTIVATPSPAANADGWNNTSVTVSYTCTDSGTGVDTAASSLGDDVLTASGTATATCVDLAGNTSTATYTAQIDTDKPVVSFSGNKGSYGVLATVAVSCSATDAESGVASSTCPAVNAPAWSLGAGSHTLTATATDKAGNTGTASTTYTVTVAPKDLATLTTQFVQGSAKYRSSGVLARLLVSVIVNSVSQAELQAAQTARPATKAALIKAYDQGVTGLAQSGWLTPAQASTLTGLATAL